MKTLNFKQYIISVLLIFSALIVNAQIPAGYYSDAEMKAGGQLKTSLHNIIKVGTRLSYGSGEGKTWSGFAKTDRHPEGHVWDMYSLNKVPFNGNSAASGMNIEHSFAKSWWGGSNNDAYKDLFHLNPSNSTANSARSSYPLGEVSGNGSWNNGSIKVGTNTFGSYSGQCFEPEDQYKGDFARAYMYMITCYENLKLNSSTNASSAIQSDVNYKYTFKPWFKDLLMKWHRQDPVSQKELTRQAEIYKLQNNRNPFIDYPILAEHLWGTLVGQLWSSSGSATSSYISQPYDNTTITLPSTPVLTMSSDTIYVKAMNLTSSLNVTISGTNASAFSTHRTTIDTTSAHSANGAMLIIEFNPTILNNQTATLTINGGGAINSVTITLNGEGTNEFKATNPTNITTTSFTANWSTDFGATDYILNVFKYIDNGETGETEIFRTSFENDKFQDGVSKVSGYTAWEYGALRLASGSQDGVIELPSLDLSSDNVVLTVEAKRYGTDSSPFLYIYVDDNELGYITTTANMEEHTFNIGNHNTNSTITLKAKQDKRVLLKKLYITDQGSVLSRDTLAGYPVNTGDVRSYDVTVPNFNSPYYYEITSVNGTTNTTNEVKVEYITSSTDQLNSSSINVYTNGSIIYINNIEISSTIDIYSLNGTLITQVQANNNTSLDLGQYAKGIYILNIHNNNSRATFKVITGK